MINTYNTSFFSSTQACIIGLFLLMIPAFLPAQNAVKQDSLLTVTAYIFNQVSYEQSVLITTYPDGSQEIKDLKNAKILQDKPLAQNDFLVTKKLNEILQKGWTLFSQTTTVTPSSPNDEGVIYHRYIFVK